MSAPRFSLEGARGLGFGARGSVLLHTASDPFGAQDLELWAQNSRSAFEMHTVWCLLKHTQQNYGVLC